MHDVNPAILDPRDTYEDPAEWYTKAKDLAQRFIRNFEKYTDPEFQTVQSIAYLPLNLVIDELDYYYSEILGKLPFPYLYTLFIGWIPVVLALLGFVKAKAKDRRIIWFLASSIVIEFMIGSAILFKWLAPFIPQIAGIRHPPLIAGLAVPLILGLSAYGLDYLLNISWPKNKLSISASNKDRFLQISFRLIVMVMLFFSLYRGYLFSQYWMNTKHLSEETLEILNSLSTESLAWVNPPSGEHSFIDQQSIWVIKLVRAF